MLRVSSVPMYIVLTMETASRNDSIPDQTIFYLLSFFIFRHFIPYITRKFLPLLKVLWPTKRKSNKFSGLEEILGYKFSKPELLEEAMTHSSCNSSVNYEKLEVMGDVVINLLVAKELYSRYPDLVQGKFTRLRELNVEIEKFARATIKHGLYEYLIHNEKTFLKHIQKFKVEIEYYKLYSNGLIDPPKFLADILESTAGAVYKDSGYNLDTVWKVFKPLLEPLIPPEKVKSPSLTELKELGDAGELEFKFSDYENEEVTLSVTVKNPWTWKTVIGRSPRKAIAKTRAAHDALEKLRPYLGCDCPRSHQGRNTWASSRS